MFKKIMRSIIICSALLMSSVLLAKPAFYLAPFKAVYAVKLFGLEAGTVTRTLTLNKTWHYHFTVVTQSQIPALQVKIFESSQGQWTTDGPQPKKYTYHYQVFNKQKNITSDLNWTTHTAKTTKITHEYTRHYTAKFPKDIQDKLSYQLMLRLNLKYAANQFTYPILNQDEIDTYSFKIVGHQTLNTPMGQIKTIKMEYSDHNKKNENAITFWIAPKFHDAPIKIINIENGVIVAEANLKSYQDLQ